MAKPKIKNVHTLAARQRKSGPMSSKNALRGGARNDFLEYLDEYKSSSDVDSYDSYEDDYCWELQAANDDEANLNIMRRIHIQETHDCAESMSVGAFGEDAQCAICYILKEAEELDYHRYKPLTAPLEEVFRDKDPDKK